MIADWRHSNEQQSCRHKHKAENSPLKPQLQSREKNRSKVSLETLDAVPITYLSILFIHILSFVYIYSFILYVYKIYIVLHTDSQTSNKSEHFPSLRKFLGAIKCYKGTSN